MRRTASLLKADTLWQSLSAGLFLAVSARFFGFARGILLARIMSPVELGTWALLANAVEILAFVLVFGVPSALGRYVERYRRQGRLPALLTQLAAATLGAAAVVCTLGMIYHRPVGELLFGAAASRMLVGVTLLAMFAMAASNFARGAMHGLRLFRLDGWIDLAQNAGFFALACVLLLAWRADAAANAWAMVGVTLFTTMIAAALIARVIHHAEHPAATSLPPPPGDGPWRTIAVYALATWSAGSIQAIWSYLDRYVLLHIGHLPADAVLEQIGGYYIASKLAQPLTVVAGVLSIVLLPHAARLWEEQNRDEVGRLLRLTLKASAVLLTLGGAALLTIKEPLLAILVGRVPESAVLVAAPVTVTVVTVALHFVLRAWLLCRERVWIISGLWAAALVANLLLNLWLVPRWLLYGAALSTLISSTLATLGTAWLSSRDGLSLDVGSWLACLLPLSLLLPVPAMFVCLASLASAALCSPLLFSADEKMRCRAQLERLMSDRYGRRAAQPVPPTV